MATVCDAADAAISTSFGPTPLLKFVVVTEKVDQEAVQGTSEITVAA